LNFTTQSEDCLGFDLEQVNDADFRFNGVALEGGVKNKVYYFSPGYTYTPLFLDG
jgi:hypothetical protein